jgi:hypothetical protein
MSSCVETDEIETSETKTSENLEEKLLEHCLTRDFDCGMRRHLCPNFVFFTKL